MDIGNPTVSENPSEISETPPVSDSHFASGHELPTPTVELQTRLISPSGMKCMYKPKPEVPKTLVTEVEGDPLEVVQARYTAKWKTKNENVAVSRKAKRSEGTSSDLSSPRGPRNLEDAYRKQKLIRDLLNVKRRRRNRKRKKSTGSSKSGSRRRKPVAPHNTTEFLMTDQVEVKIEPVVAREKLSIELSEDDFYMSPPDEDEYYLKDFINTYGNGPSQTPNPNVNVEEEGLTAEEAIVQMRICKTEISKLQEQVNTLRAENECLKKRCFSTKSPLCAEALLFESEDTESDSDSSSASGGSSSDEDEKTEQAQENEAGAEIVAAQKVAEVEK